jgi:hypothetical protein
MYVALNYPQTILYIQFLGSSQIYSPPTQFSSISLIPNLQEKYISLKFRENSMIVSNSLRNHLQIIPSTPDLLGTQPLLRLQQVLHHYNILFVWADFIRPDFTRFQILNPKAKRLRITPSFCISILLILAHTLSS